MLNDQDIEKLYNVLAPRFEGIEKSILQLEESISNLAIITKNGLDNCVTKEEFHEFKEEMISFKEDSETFQKNITHSITALDDKVERIDTRLKNVETSITPLASENKVIKNEVQHLNLRMDQVEEKLGIVS